MRVLFFCPEFLHVLAMLLMGLPKNDHSIRWNAISFSLVLHYSPQLLKGKKKKKNKTKKVDNKISGS